MLYLNVFLASFVTTWLSCKIKDLTARSCSLVLIMHTLYSKNNPTPVSASTRFKSSNMVMRVFAQSGTRVIIIVSKTNCNTVCRTGQDKNTHDLGLSECYS